MYDGYMDTEQITLTTHEKLRIQIMRKYRTTAEAAAILDISRATLSGVINGNPPTLSVAKTIEAEYGIKVDEWPTIRR